MPPCFMEFIPYYHCSSRKPTALPTASPSPCASSRRRAPRARRARSRRRAEAAGGALQLSFDDPEGMGHKGLEGPQIFKSSFWKYIYIYRYIYIWLVVYLPLWKIWKSAGVMKFPIYGKIKAKFQTTNQISKYWGTQFWSIPEDMHGDNWYQLGEPKI